jgi:hypothetical protein
MSIEEPSKSGLWFIAYQGENQFLGLLKIFGRINFNPGKVCAGHGMNRNGLSAGSKDTLFIMEIHFAVLEIFRGFNEDEFQEITLKSGNAGQFANRSLLAAH